MHFTDEIMKIIYSAPKSANDDVVWRNDVVLLLMLNMVD